MNFTLTFFGDPKIKTCKEYKKETWTTKFSLVPNFSDNDSQKHNVIFTFNNNPFSIINYGERNRSYQGVAQNQDRQSVPAAGYSVKQHNGSFSLDKPLQMGMIDIYIKNVTKKLNIFFCSSFENTHKNKGLRQSGNEIWMCKDNID